MKVILILVLLFVVATKLKRWLRVTVAAPQRRMKTVKAEPLPELEFHQDQR